MSIFFIQGKSILMRLLLLILIILMVGSLCKDLIPQNYEASQKLLSLGIDITLSQKSKKFAKINQNKWSLGYSFQLIDKSQNLIASAKQILLKVGTDYEITDSNDVLIGRIVYPFKKNWLSLYNFLDVQDQNRKLISYVRFRKIFGIYVQVFDPQHKKIMEMERSFSLFESKWSIKTKSSKNLNQKSKIIHSFIPSIIAAHYQEQNSDDIDDE